MWATTLLHGNQTLNTVYVTEGRSDDFLTKMGQGLERTTAMLLRSATRTNRGIAW